jgi:hypothetical protein
VIARGKAYHSHHPEPTCLSPVPPSRPPATDDADQERGALTDHLIGDRRRTIAVLTCIVMVTVAACGSASSPTGTPTSRTTVSTTTPTAPATEASVAPTSSAMATTIAALTTPGPDSGCPSAACSAVTSRVAAATHVTQVPTDLIPTLENAGTDLVAPPNCVRSKLDVPVSPANEPCTIGTDPSAPDIVLFGDSHALMWATSFASLARRVGDRFTLLDFEACRLPIAVQFSNLPVRCDAWRQAAIDWIRHDHPALVAVSSIYNPGDAVPASAYVQLANGWGTLLADITGPGTRLAVIGSIPALAQDGPTCLAIHPSDVQSCSTSPSTALITDTLAAEQAAAAREGASFVNPTPWLCTAAVCPAVIGRFNVYENRFHITSTYGNYLSPVLQRSLNIGT